MSESDLIDAQGATGNLIPLDLFPASVQRVALLLPFRFTLSFPVERALGRLVWVRSIRSYTSASS